MTRWSFCLSVVCLLGVLAAGCDASSSSEPEPPDPTDLTASVLAPRAGWPDDVAVTTVDAPSAVRQVRVRADAAGNLVVLRRRGTEIISLLGETVLSRFDRDGHARGDIATEGVVLDYAVQPGGDVVTAELVRSPGVADDPSAVEANVVLARYAGTRATVRARLEDQGTPSERRMYYVRNGKVEQVDGYEPVGDTGLREAPFGSLFRSTTLSLQPGGLYLVAPTHGLKVYKLDDALRPLWAAQVAPFHDGLHSLSSTPLPLVEDAHGRAWVASSLTPNSAAAHQAQYGEAPAQLGNADVLLTALDVRTGARLGTSTLGTAENDALTTLARRDDELVLVSNARRTKFARDNDTTEWDVSILRARIEPRTLALTQTSAVFVDLSREDLVDDALVLASGDVLVAGTSDFLQVDTNSWVENGAGMLARIAPDGAVVKQRLLRGPRHVSAESIAPLTDGQVALVGTLDAPITHTCEGQPTDSPCHDAQVFLGRTSL